MGFIANESTDGLQIVGNGFLNFIYFLVENWICGLRKMHRCAQCIMGGD